MGASGGASFNSIPTATAASIDFPRRSAFFINGNIQVSCEAKFRYKMPEVVEAHRRE